MPRTPKTPNSMTPDGQRRKSVQLDETIMEDNRPGPLKISSEFPAFADVLKLKL